MSGSLSGSVVLYSTTATQSINLTSLGSIDWAAFGYNTNAASIERKSTGGSKISALSQVGSVALANWNNTSGVPAFLSTWSDGTPDSSISGEGYLVYSNGPALGAGMSFTVPADTTSRTLLVYVGISYNSSSLAEGKLTATLSDSSAGPYTDTSINQTSGSTNLLGLYTIVYNAASSGQTLTIQWVNNTSNAQNVQIYAAALNATAVGSLSGSVVTYTTTQNLNLTSLGGVDWAAFGYNTNAASIQRKSTGGSLISALSQVGSPSLLNYDNTSGTPTFLSSWTNGTPTSPITSEGYLVYSAETSLGDGLSFTVPAGTASQTLTIYVAVSPNAFNVTGGKLTATLSDSSAGPYVDTSIQMTDATALLIGAYTIIFNAGSSGQTLTIDWVNNTTNGQNVQIYAAVLNNTTVSDSLNLGLNITANSIPIAS